MATQFQPRTETGRFEEEGVTRKAERMAAQVPPGTYLTAALASVVLSAATQLMGRKHLSLFVGQWAPTFLLMGIYDKMVRSEGA